LISNSSVYTILQIFGVPGLIDFVEDVINPAFNNYITALVN